MAEVKLTIPDNKIGVVKEAMAGLYAIPVDIDPETGVQTPKFTKDQWAKEIVKKFIIQQVARWKQIEAQKLIPYQEDQGLVS